MSESPPSQYTSTFLELLSKSKKSLLVSTYQARKLVLLRVQGNELNTHFVDLQKPMGVALNTSSGNDRLSVGAGNSVIDYFNSNNAAAKVEPANSHDAAYLPKRAHITGDIDIHEMAFDGDDELWLVNTRMSCLCTLDLQHSFVPRWKPPFISAYDVTDRCHLNGLAMRDGKPRYVTALGNSNSPAGWRDNKAAGGILMDIQSNQIIAQGLSMPHSPRWYRDKLWVLESGAGQLITVDENTGEKTVVAQLPGFCRGIDFMERYALIGLSEVRETAIFAGLPLTEREQNRKCGVWIVDIETGATAGYLAFTSGVQEIFSVQCLPHSYPALLEFNHPLLNTTYSVPDEVIGQFAAPNPHQIKIDQAFELHARKEYALAINSYREVIEADPGNNNVLYALAEALTQSKQWHAASELLEQLISRQATNAEALSLLGQYFYRNANFNAAVAHFDKAVAIDQQFASAHFHRGCAMLAQGNFKEGWQGFEWRTQTKGFKRVNLPHPKWQAEDISEQTLLVYTEQDFSDAIMFARFLAPARQRCKKLIVVCHEPLEQLFRSMQEVDEVLLHGTLASELFDLQISIMSLPAILEVSVENLPRQPYLDIKQQKISKSADRNQFGTNGKIKVGLLWPEGSIYPQAEKPSLPIQQITDALENPDVVFYSFQLSINVDDKPWLEQNKIVDLSSQLTDLAQTAALMQQMDWIISVDSSAAHMAGALGINTVLLVSGVSDWRWMSNNARSSWYPSIRLQQLATGSCSSDSLEYCKRLITL